MKPFTAALILVVLMLVPGCKQKKSSSDTPPQTLSVQSETKPVNFVPPRDSVISAEKIKIWLSCNPLLDSLTTMYSDSFKIEEPERRMRYQEVFSAAQDRICVRAGLPGGYKEYKWIMNAMGNPKNKAALDSSGQKCSKNPPFFLLF